MCFLVAQLVKNLPAMQKTSLIPGLGRSAGEGIGYPLQYYWASLVAQLIKNPPAMQEADFNPWLGKIPWRRERLPTRVFWPGEFHGLHRWWGCKESDTSEWLSLNTSDASSRVMLSRDRLITRTPDSVIKCLPEYQSIWLSITFK